MHVYVSGYTSRPGQARLSRLIIARSLARPPLPHIPLDNLITRSIPNTILPPPPSNHPLDMCYRLRNRPFSVPLE
jgi:hypothetical protein